MGYQKAWLNYHPVKEQSFHKYLTAIYCDNDDAMIRSAIKELSIAAKEMYGVTLPLRPYLWEGGIQLRIVDAADLGQEGYNIYPEDNAFIIEGSTSKGILYGTFQLLRRLQCEENASSIVERKTPDNPLRMLNHWDNIDGTIERGYAGNSIFFNDNEIILNDRTIEYARLAASVGINGVVINNVNVRSAATELITERYFKPLRKLQKILHSYGIKLYLSLNFAASMEIGGLDTADPFAEEVIGWWRRKLKEVYTELPGFGGFLIKADSEGRPGPFTYGRTHAEGANLLADIIKPYGGLIIWRCFVYNCRQDWRDRKTDRARAAYDHFKPLDGTFADNVILQIKNGPMDFQVREPVSPLFGAMQKTNPMLEVQLTQEYTGQQIHICYLIPMFKEILGFKTYYKEDKDKVEDIISGRTFGQTNCGIAAVANIGNDANWTGHDLAAANLYGYGRLSFDTGLTAEEIAQEWIWMSFGKHPKVTEVVKKILMISWFTYEKYTSPLGIGWMVNPSHHYGPNVEGYEYDRWGTYHRADHKGIGVDRTKKGTGYVTQYQEPNSSLYNSMDTCPEELLLFFHYVEYTHRLSSGKTLIQHIYDTHFEGVEEVASMLIMWKELSGLISSDVYDRVLSRLQKQYNHSLDWRDVICSYFYRKTFIPDEKGREIY